MSRHGYQEDGEDNWQLIMWRGRVTSAIRGRRGQSLLRRMAAALDAMPEKRLIQSELQDEDGDRCALGCVLAAEGKDPREFDPTDWEGLARELDVAECLIREVEYENDGSWADDERRWQYMRGWVENNLKKTENAT